MISVVIGSVVLAVERRDEKANWIKLLQSALQFGTQEVLMGLQGWKGVKWVNHSQLSK
jgi:hypothetical protein